MYDSPLLLSFLSFRRAGRFLQPQEELRSLVVCILSVARASLTEDALRPLQLASSKEHTTFTGKRLQMTLPLRALRTGKRAKAQLTKNGQPKNWRPQKGDTVCGRGKSDTHIMVAKLSSRISLATS